MKKLLLLALFLGVCVVEAQAQLIVTRGSAKVPDQVYETAIGTATVFMVNVTSGTNIDVLLGITLQNRTEVHVQNQDATSDMWCKFRNDAAVDFGWKIPAGGAQMFAIPLFDQGSANYVLSCITNDAAGTILAAIMQLAPF